MHSDFSIALPPKYLFITLKNVLTWPDVISLYDLRYHTTGKICCITLEPAKLRKNTISEPFDLSCLITKGHIMSLSYQYNDQLLKSPIPPKDNLAV